MRGTVGIQPTGNRKQVPAEIPHDRVRLLLHQNVSYMGTGHCNSYHGPKKYVYAYGGAYKDGGVTSVPGCVRREGIGRQGIAMQGRMQSGPGLR